jgi:hypothetical protein
MGIEGAGETKVRESRPYRNHHGRMSGINWSSS